MLNNISFAGFKFSYFEHTTYNKRNRSALQTVKVTKGLHMLLTQEWKGEKKNRFYFANLILYTLKMMPWKVKCGIVCAKLSNFVFKWMMNRLFADYIDFSLSPCFTKMVCGDSRVSPPLRIVEDK